MSDLSQPKPPLRSSPLTLTHSHANTTRVVYAAANCKCVGCVHSFVHMTGIQFSKNCFSACSANDHCLMALHAVKTGICHLYKHAPKKVTQLRRKNTYRCYVKATICPDGIPAEPWSCKPAQAVYFCSTFLAPFGWSYKYLYNRMLQKRLGMLWVDFRMK